MFFWLGNPNLLWLVTPHRGYQSRKALLRPFATTLLDGPKAYLIAAHGSLSVFSRDPTVLYRTHASNKRPNNSDHHSTCIWAKGMVVPMALPEKWRIDNIDMTNGFPDHEISVYTDSQAAMPLPTEDATNDTVLIISKRAHRCTGGWEQLNTLDLWGLAGGQANLTLMIP